VLACGLLVAIFFVCIQSPSRETATAQQQIAEIDQSVKDLESNPDKLTVEVLDKMNEALERVAETLAQHSNELDSIETCQREESEEFRGKLVSLEQQFSSDQPAECECSCNCKAEFDSLKARIAALEAKASTVTTTAATTAKVASYPSVSSVVSYGSTGSTVSYGSTGSAVVSYQYTPAPTPAPPLPVTSVNVQSGCYVDQWGRTQCPQRAEVSVLESRRLFFPNLRKGR
jgi:prefoldin subunit 5